MKMVSLNYFFYDKAKNKTMPGMCFFGRNKMGYSQWSSAL